MSDVQRWAIPAGYTRYRATLNSEDVEHVVLASDYDALAAENAALKGQLAYAIEIRDGYLKAGNELCAEKDAENAKLREALRGCVADYDRTCPSHMFVEPVHITVARAAVQPSGERT